MKHEIFTLIGKNCITPSDGQHVYDLVIGELLADRPVETDDGEQVLYLVSKFSTSFW